MFIKLNKKITHTRTHAHTQTHTQKHRWDSNPSPFEGEAITPQSTVLRTDQNENTYWLDFSMQFE